MTVSCKSHQGKEEGRSRGKRGWELSQINIPSENDLVREYCGQSPEVSQSETVENEKNGFLKTFLDFIQFSGV